MGRRLGAAAVMTAVFHTGPGGAESWRRPSTATRGSEWGGSGASNHHVTRPLVGGSGRVVRVAAPIGSVATTAPRARRLWPSTRTSTPPCVGVMDSTWLLRRTRSPSGPATCSGRACMPVAGTAGRPRANIRTSRLREVGGRAAVAVDEDAGEEGVEHLTAEATRDTGLVE